MNIFVRTAFGASTRYYSSEDGNLFQAAAKGNRTVPAIWLIISIFLVIFIYKSNMVTTLTSYISDLIYDLVTLIYVDDTYL